MMQTMRYIQVFLIAAALLAAGCKSTKNDIHANKAKEKTRVVTPVVLETEAMMIEAKMNQELEQTEKAVKGYQTILTRDPNYGAAL